MGWFGSIFGGGRPKDDIVERAYPTVSIRAADITYDSWNLQDQTWSSASATGLQVNQQTAMQVTSVMACVRMLAEDMAKLVPELFDVTVKEKRRVAESHVLHRLFNVPNSWQTWPEFCSQMQIGLVLRGNAFAVILRDIHGNPEALVPLNPDRVALWETPNGSLFYAVTRSGMHEQFVLRDQPFLIPYRDMFHLKSLSTNGLMGFSPIAVARESVGLALAQEQQAARWMGQASRPSGILTTDQALTEEAAKRMSEDWRAIQSGVQNSGRTAILEQGLKFQALTLTAADVDFFRAREFQVQEIARLFRVPIAMLTEVGSSSRVDPDILAQHYYNHTLSSHVNIWAARFNVTFDLWESNLRVEFDASKILEADMSRRIDMHRSAVNGGLETQNEGRRGIGLDPVEGGDVLLLPGNSVPFGSDKSGDAPIGAGRPTAAGAQNPDQPGAGA